MKTLIFFICLGSIVLSFTWKKKDYSKEEDCRTVLDSDRILAGTGEFVFSWKANKPDKETFYRVSKWFEKRSFAELRCLLESNDKAYMFYGYVYAAMSNYDSLGNNYSFLLTDTSSVQYNAAEGLVDTKETMGKLLQLMREEETERQENWKKRPAIEKIVADFIKEYASHPDTYKGISFPFFSMADDREKLTEFKIHHTYEIKNNRGELVSVTSAFVLTPELHINIIAQDSTSFSRSYPPMLTNWLTSYGRPLGHEDSVRLRLR